MEDLDEETHLLEYAKLNDAPEAATGVLSVIEQQLLLLRAQVLSKSRAMESTLIEQMRAHIERVFVRGVRAFTHIAHSRHKDTTRIQTQL